VNIVDKEELVEELEEHIAQVREATFKNPFVMVGDRLIMNALIAHQGAANFGMDRDTWNDCHRLSILITSDQMQ
jgi:hypothetical protein